MLPSLRPMLPLLDLHGIKRIDFHNSVLEDLRDKLISQIDACSKMEGRDRDKKLKDLLLKSFPVIKIAQLRPVVMAVLKNMVFIEDKYLRVLVRDKENRFWSHLIYLVKTRVKNKNKYAENKCSLLYTHGVCTIRTSAEVLVLGVEPESNIMVVL